MEEHINSAGQGSHYCLDGCGYYHEFTVDIKNVKAHQAPDRVQERYTPAPKKKRRG
jgi:hypothetical protein